MKIIALGLLALASVLLLPFCALAEEPQPELTQLIAQIEARRAAKAAAAAAAAAKAAAECSQAESREESSENAAILQVIHSFGLEAGNGVVILEDDQD